MTAPGDFKTGAGLHSGPVVIGNVGSAEKMEFTVLGEHGEPGVAPGEHE